MGDEVEMDEAANIPNDNGIPLRGMIDLPNEIFDKILSKLRPKERGKVRILSRSLRSRVNSMDPRYNRYKIVLTIEDLPENQLFYEDNAEVELDLYKIEHDDPKMEKLAKWLEKSSHRLTKLKGSPIVLNQVANGYIAATRLINMEIMGQKFNHRALDNPWVPSLHTLWLECVDLRISSGQTINLPNLKVLHLRDVVMLTPIAENAAAANKKLKTDNLGLVNILKGCRTTLEFLELYTIDISGIVHFGQDLPKLKELKLVRSNDEDGLKALFEACKTSLEKLVHQEMVLHCLEDFSTHMECLKRIETDCDINGITLIKKCASTLEYLDVKSFDGANNFLGFDTPLPALKSIKACHSRGGRLGLGRLVALSCQTLETLCIEKINLYHEMRIISFQLPCLKTLRISKCEGEEPVIQLLRASQHSIETLVTESLTCRFPSSIDFDMPNLKFVTVGLCKRDVMHTLQMRCHPDVRIVRYR